MKKFVSLLLPAILCCCLHISAQYNGNDRFATLQSGLPDNSPVFTIECWIKTTESRGSDVYWQRPYIFGNETNGDNSGDFGVTLNYGYIGMWEGISSLNTDQQFTSASLRVNDDLWHHIAAVNNGQTISLYVDGKITASLVSGKRLSTFSAPITFGAASLDHDFNGNIPGRKNFAAAISFGDARFSSNVRYAYDFSPSNMLASDANTVSLLHLGSQQYNSTPINPDEPVNVDPSQPINSLADLVTLAKSKPGKLNYGTAGIGTPGHLTAEMFRAVSGIDIQHVPYKGGAPGITDLIGGQIQIMFDPLQSVLSNVQGGKLRALAVSSKTRSAAVPDVPTIAESGYGGFETTAWWGVFAPAGLPDALTATLIAEVERIAASDAFRSRLEPLGVTPDATLGGTAFANYQRSELVKWGKAVKDAGVKID